MISVDEAKKLIIKDSVVSGWFETINCRQALKRILNTPVVSLTDHPPFNQSAMHGIIPP